ncbi:MAG: hypothetical protein AMJ73_07935 [candidate division Zixibacteria bacterium SM1_73]|nr:MAG: hypothetical protein AMJ73_07935 [candidate division Zixibacteria bacterium SM1_73]
MAKSYITQKLLLSFVLFSITFVACAGSSRYVSPDEVNQFDDRYSETDMRIMSQKMAESIISNTEIAGREDPCTIGLLHIDNRTSEYIDTDAISDKIMVALLKTGKVKFVDRKILDDIFKELGLSSSGFIDPSQVKKAGKALSVDYFLAGQLESIHKEDRRKSLTFYRLSMRLINTETTEIVWADEQELKKKKTKGILKW